jgi:hypothetical protein
MRPTILVEEGWPSLIDHRPASVECWRSRKGAASRSSARCRGIGSHHREGMRASLFGPTRRLNSIARRQSYPGPSGEDAETSRPISRCRIAVTRQYALGSTARGFMLTSSPSGRSERLSRAICGAVRRAAKRSTIANKRTPSIPIAELPAGRRDRDNHVAGAGHGWRVVGTGRR